MSEVLLTQKDLWKVNMNLEIVLWKISWDVYKLLDSEDYSLLRLWTLSEGKIQSIIEIIKDKVDSISTNTDLLEILDLASDIFYVKEFIWWIFSVDKEYKRIIEIIKDIIKTNFIDNEKATLWLEYTFLDLLDLLNQAKLKPSLKSLQKLIFKVENIMSLWINILNLENLTINLKKDPIIWWLISAIFNIEEETNNENYDKLIIEINKVKNSWIYLNDLENELQYLKYKVLLNEVKQWYDEFLTSVNIDSFRTFRALVKDAKEYLSYTFPWKYTDIELSKYELSILDRAELIYWSDISSKYKEFNKNPTSENYKELLDLIEEARLLWISEHPIEKKVVLDTKWQSIEMIMNSDETISKVRSIIIYDVQNWTSTEIDISDLEIIDWKTIKFNVDNVTDSDCIIFEVEFINKKWEEKLLKSKQYYLIDRKYKNIINTIRDRIPKLTKAVEISSNGTNHDEIENRISEIYKLILKLWELSENWINVNMSSSNILEILDLLRRCFICKDLNRFIKRFNSLPSFDRYGEIVKLLEIAIKSWIYCHDIETRLYKMKVDWLRNDWKFIIQNFWANPTIEKYWKLQWIIWNLKVLYEKIWVDYDIEWLHRIALENELKMLPLKLRNWWGLKEFNKLRSCISEAKKVWINIIEWEENIEEYRKLWIKWELKVSLDAFLETPSKKNLEYHKEIIEFAENNWVDVKDFKDNIRAYNQKVIEFEENI